MDEHQPISCIDDDGRVVRWVCCQSCRYNLFGLTVHGKCPECGAAISLSTVASQVRSTPSAQLRSIRIVAGLIRLAIGALFLAIIVGIGAILAGAAAGIAIFLLASSVLCVVAAGFSASSSADSDHSQRTRESRADFTDSLIVAPVLAPLLSFIAGVLTPTIARFSGRSVNEPPLSSLVFALLAALVVSLLAWLVFLVLIRPITTLTRFLAELFEHSWPMNPDRTISVFVMAKLAHWLIFASISLGLASILIDGDSISTAVVRFAGLAGALGAIAVLGSLCRLFFLLGDVRGALAGPILEARQRESEDGSGRSAV